MTPFICNRTGRQATHWPNCMDMRQAGGLVEHACGDAQWEDLYFMSIWNPWAETERQWAPMQKWHCSRFYELKLRVRNKWDCLEVLCPSKLLKNNNSCLFEFRKLSQELFKTWAPISVSWRFWSVLIHLNHFHTNLSRVPYDWNGAYKFQETITRRHHGFCCRWMVHCFHQLSLCMHHLRVFLSGTCRADLLYFRQFFKWFN